MSDPVVERCHNADKVLDLADAAETALGPVLHPAHTIEELARRLEELNALENRLAESDNRLNGLRGELRSYEKRYFKLVGIRYVELDRLEAEIAEALVKLSPDEIELRERAYEARKRAEQMESIMEGEELDDDEDGSCHAPSHHIRRLYRKIAFEMHPDRSTDSDEIDYRHELMVEANKAYREGDHQALEALLEEFRRGSFAGIGGDEQQRLVRRIERARRKLDDIDEEISALEQSELYRLWRTSEIHRRDGRDYLMEKAESLDRAIKRARNRLIVLQAEP